jgi:UPF0176 protein
MNAMFIHLEPISLISRAQVLTVELVIQQRLVIPAAMTATYQVAAFYKFLQLHNHRELQASLSSQLKKLGVKGIVLLANEGINGTIAAIGTMPEALEAIKAAICTADLDYKLSTSGAPPFKRLKVRLKKEIVTMGEPLADPNKQVGTYVEPSDWNALISDPDVILIDTRNDYEVAIGTFRNAMDPRTESFGEFPDFVRNKLSASKNAKIAMFCTGGIRCEKASSFMKLQGYENVYHLKGGILKYLEVTPPEESLWQGDCFVFDERVAVGHGLTQSDVSMCFGCQQPVTAQDRQSPLYEKGVSCPRCASQLTVQQRASNRERQKQIDLARKRGQKHLGPVEN